MGNLRYNPHAVEHNQLSTENKHVCRACRGAGKIINNQHGDQPKVFGKENAQGHCPSCMGSGFHQRINMYKHVARV
jgi:DnaJ-class molecular chaperone